MAPDPPREPQRERERREQAAEVEGRGGRAGVARREPKVARRPDPERLDRRDLVVEVAEPAAQRRVPERPEVTEVHHPSPLGRGEDEQHANRRRHGDRRVRAQRTLGIHASRRPRNPAADVRWSRTRRSPYEQNRQVDDRRSGEPEEAGEAIGVDGAGGDQRERERAAHGRRARQEQGEREQEERLDRLLERPLREVGSGQVRKGGHRAGDDPGGAAKAVERFGRHGGGERRDREGQAAEGLDETGAEGGVERGGERVWADRVALVEQDRHVAQAVREPVGDQEVIGHVVVDEAHPEHPRAPVDDERDGREEEGERCRCERNCRVRPQRTLGVRASHRPRNPAADVRWARTRHSAA